MATADDVLASLRRNRTIWSLRRQMTQTVQQTKVTIPAAITTSTDPALAPLGTELANYSDEFDGTSLNGAWQWTNQGASTATFRSGRLLLTPEVSGNPANNSERILMRPAPPGSWTVRTKMTHNATILYGGGGLVAYRGANGAFLLQSALCRVASAPTSCRLLTAYWTNVTTLSTVVRDDNAPLLETRQWTMQMRYDGANFLVDYSTDNVVFYNIATVTALAALGGAPDYIGMGGNQPTAVTPSAAVAFEWFRVYGDANLNRP